MSGAPVECGFWVSRPAGVETRGGLCYTVRRGDTLASIARTVYGHETYWPRIRAANRSKVSRDGNLVLVGTPLDLPSIQVQVTPAAGECTPCPDAGPEPEEGQAGGEGWTGVPEAVQLLFPTLNYSCELLKLTFDVGPAIVEGVVSGSVTVTKQGGVVAPYATMSKDGISLAYDQALERFSSGFSLSWPGDGAAPTVSFSLLSYKAEWVTVAVGVDPPRKFKFSASPTEPLKLTVDLDEDHAPYELTIQLASIELSIELKEPPELPATVPSEEAERQAVRDAMRRIAEMQARGFVVSTVVVLVGAAIAVAGAPVAGAAAAAAGVTLLARDAFPDHFDLPERWTTTVGGGA